MKCYCLRFETINSRESNYFRTVHNVLCSIRTIFYTFFWAEDLLYVFWNYGFKIIFDSERSEVAINSIMMFIFLFFFKKYLVKITCV